MRAEVAKRLSQSQEQLDSREAAALWVARVYMVCSAHVWPCQN